MCVLRECGINIRLILNITRLIVACDKGIEHEQIFRGDNLARMTSLHCHGRQAAAHELIVDIVSGRQSHLSDRMVNILQFNRILEIEIIFHGKLRILLVRELQYHSRQVIRTVKIKILLIIPFC